MARRIVIAGGSGLIGGLLSRNFIERGDDVTILTRGKKRGTKNIHYVCWDPEAPRSLHTILNGVDVVIGLNGASVDSRYTSARKWKILHSRLAATWAIGDAIGKCEAPPKVWIQASTATIYRHAEDRPMDQFTGEIGSGFSVEVARTWEAVAKQAAGATTRLVLLRSAMVLGREGGVLPRLVQMVRAGLGGRHSNGEQFVSWIHGRDLIGAVEYLIENEDAVGVYDVAAPVPVRDRVLMEMLRSHLRPWISFPKPEWMLQLGAWIMRTETELILKSRQVVPTRLLQEGFRFQHPTITTALVDLLRPMEPRRQAVLDHQMQLP
jgi:uncharacterized protein (TIGR01777 family)